MPVGTAKPVHIITNDEEFINTLLHYGIWVEIASHDYTEELQYHQHILAFWPLKEGKLSPARRTVIKRARRRYTCSYCDGKTFLGKCPICNTYYKPIWSKTEDHTINIKDYIKRKIEADPSTKVADNTGRQSIAR